jgi:hypothetical protein
LVTITLWGSWGVPCSQRAKISFAPAAYRACASRVVPEKCATIPLPPPRGFFIVLHGWFLGAGWTSHTSPEYPENTQRTHELTGTDRTSERLRASLTVDVPTLQRLLDRETVANSATRGVDDPRALLDVLERLLVKETARALVQRAVDGDDIALCEQVLKLLDAADFDSLGGLCVGDGAWVSGCGKARLWYKTYVGVRECSQSRAALWGQRALNATLQPSHTCVIHAKKGGHDIPATLCNQYDQHRWFR